MHIHISKEAITYRRPAEASAPTRTSQKRMPSLLATITHSLVVIGARVHARLNLPACDKRNAWTLANEHYHTNIISNDT
jgi:hypothetical protein